MTVTRKITVRPSRSWSRTTLAGGVVKKETRFSSLASCSCVPRSSSPCPTSSLFRR